MAGQFFLLLDNANKTPRRRREEQDIFFFADYGHLVLIGTTAGMKIMTVAWVRPTGVFFLLLSFLSLLYLFASMQWREGKQSSKKMIETNEAHFFFFLFFLYIYSGTEMGVVSFMMWYGWERSGWSLKFLSLSFIYVCINPF